MRVLILGGYGNFGKRIAQLLTGHGIAVIIAGRDRHKAAEVVSLLPAGLSEIATFDANFELDGQLNALRPGVVINTCGPFQGAGYGIARTCIAAGVHYIDLADGRDFVAGIGHLDGAARQHGVAVISGASTVPALTSAVIEQFRDRFATTEALSFGISPGQKAERGLATTQGILSYIGKKLAPCAGYPTRYGWQDLYRQTYPDIGARWMANCDIPDLDLLPPRYGIKRIRFSAGIENPALHLGLWLASWWVRLGMPADFAGHASTMLKFSHWFDILGSADGGMHIILEGRDKSGRPLTIKWFIVALDGDGPYIPVIPAVILTRRISNGNPISPGVTPCMGMVSLSDYLDELKPFKIKTYEFEHPSGAHPAWQ